MDENWGYYTKWNKLEEDKFCVIPLICEILKLDIETESSLVASGGRMGEIGENGQSAHFQSQDEWVLGI